MKRIILILLLTTFVSFSQESKKKIEIYKHISGEYLNAIKFIDEGKEKDLKIEFIGRNHKYQQIDDLIVFSYSSPIEFYSFLNKLIEGFKNEEGTTIVIDGLNVSVEKMLGKKVLTVYEKNNLGYRMFNEKNLNKILEKFENWCISNNIQYK